MNTARVGGQNLGVLLHRVRPQRGILFGTLIVAALLAFEIFNYSTTDFALTDLLGDLRFAGLRWATILAIAFCGIDFAGIARLFTPEQGADEPAEIWYLFGAWLLAATMNAMLTWWGISIAILNHETLGGAVVERQTLLKVVPVFVAIMVWLIRVLIIGTFSVAGERLFTQASERMPARPSLGRPAAARSQGSQRPAAASQARASTASAFRPAPKSTLSAEPEYSPEPGYGRGNSYKQEPTYHPSSLAARGESGRRRYTRR